MGSLSRKLKAEASHLYSELNLGDLLLEKFEAADGRQHDLRLATIASRYSTNYPQDRSIRPKNLDHLVDPTGVVAVASAMSVSGHDTSRYPSNGVHHRSKEKHSSVTASFSKYEHVLEDNDASLLSPEESAPSPLREAIRAELMRVNSSSQEAQ